jgi:hypothetical protein
VAQARYDKPCPGCGWPILPGHVVIRVDLPDGKAWWHRACRRKAVKALVTDGGDA